MKPARPNLDIPMPTDDIFNRREPLAPPHTPVAAMPAQTINPGTPYESPGVLIPIDQDNIDVRIDKSAWPLNADVTVQVQTSIDGTNWTNRIGFTANRKVTDDHTHCIVSFEAPEGNTGGNLRVRNVISVSGGAILLTGGTGHR